MSLVIVLLLSSFFFAKFYLTEKILDNKATEIEINFAITFGIETAEKAQLNLYKKGSVPWLNSAKKLAVKDAEITYKLATFFLKNNNISDAILWFKQGVRLKDINARLALGQLYFQQGQYLLAKNSLVNLKHNIKALRLLIRIAIINGEQEFINENVSLLNSSQQGEALYKRLLKYKIVNLEELDSQLPNLTKPSVAPPVLSTNDKCIASIQFFATNLYDLTYAEQLISQFKDNKLATFFCFSSPRYAPLNKMDCQLKTNEIISCDESLFVNITEDINTQYLAFLLPKGGANVNQGILYIDRSDTVAVLTHELTHLLGFIDEYSLPSNHAKCLQEHSETFSHNIAVMTPLYLGERSVIREKVLKQISWSNFIADTTPILQKTIQGWRVGTPSAFINEVGVFNANTCKGRALAAYKPIQQRTLLEYFELEFPETYLNILNKRKADFIMPSFHKNIAQGFLKQGNLEQANAWLNRVK